MIWLFSVAIVALVAIIGQLLLVYQKRAHELRVRQQPLRQRIKEHLRAMQESTLKIRRTASQRLEELDFEIGQMREQRDKLGKALVSLENEILGKVKAKTAEVKIAAAATGEGVVAEESEGEERRKALHEARSKIEEIDGHLSVLRREIENMTRILNRIEAKMQRRLGEQGKENLRS